MPFRATLRRFLGDVQQASGAPPPPRPPNGGNGYPEPDPNAFWGPMVTADYQASGSLWKFVGAVYNYASTLTNHNEEGLTPEQVRVILRLGNYATQHDPYHQARNAAALYGSGPRDSSVINRYMATFYKAYSIDFRYSREGVPLLTLHGHIKWLLDGILIDPTTNYRAMNLTLQSPFVTLCDPETNIPLPRSIPRHVFPAYGDRNAVLTSQQQRQQMAAMLQFEQEINSPFSFLTSLFQEAAAARLYDQGMTGLNIAANFRPF